MQGIVHDIDRPDINDTTPKMQTIANLIIRELSAPYLSISVDDNLCSSVIIRGAFQKKENWTYGIFHNASYFIIRLYPPTRYYQEGQDITVELISKGSKVNKFRKYTNTPDKVVSKIKEWITKQE